MLPVHQRFIRDAGARAATLDRALEFLPSDAEIDARYAARAGPDLAGVRGAGGLRQDRRSSDDLLGDRRCRTTRGSTRSLRGYFPPQLVERYGDRLDGHPLRREIVIDRRRQRRWSTGAASPSSSGPSEETGGHAGRGGPRLRGRPRGLRAARLRGPRSRRSTTWCRPSRRPRSTWSSGGCSTGPPAGSCRRGAPRSTSRAEIEHFAAGGRADAADARAPARRRAASGCERRTAELRRAGRAATTSPRRPRDARRVLAARRRRDRRSAGGEPPEQVGRLYFALSERFDVDRHAQPDHRRCRATTAGRRWPGWRCATTCTARWPGSPRNVLSATSTLRRPGRADRGLGRRTNAEGLARARATLVEIAASESFDLATLSVALRTIRTLVPSGARLARLPFHAPCGRSMPRWRSTKRPQVA